MQAISDRHYEMMHPSRPPPPQDVLGMGMPGMPDMLFSSADMLLPPMTHVYINAPATASPPAFEQGSSRQTSVTVLSADQYQWVEPRPLRRIDPTVSFKSAAAAPLWSTSAGGRNKRKRKGGRSRSWSRIKEEPRVVSASYESYPQHRWPTFGPLSAARCGSVILAPKPVLCSGSRVNHRLDHRYQF